jgi:hypothetical protein
MKFQVKLVVKVNLMDDWKMISMMMMMMTMNQMMLVNVDLQLHLNHYHLLKKVYRDRRQTMLRIYRVSIDFDDVHLLFELKSMRMYNRESVYKVNKQVNDNILYMMDNEVRDPLV